MKLMSFKLDLILNGDDVILAIPKSVQNSIPPRELQDLLPKLARTAPFTNKEGKVVWKVKR